MNKCLHRKNVILKKAQDCEKRHMKLTCTKYHFVSIFGQESGSDMEAVKDKYHELMVN